MYVPTAADPSRRSSADGHPAGATGTTRSTAAFAGPARYCGSCGVEVRPKASFCSACGAPAAAPPPAQPGGPRRPPQGRPPAGPPWATAGPPAGGAARSSTGRPAVDLLIAGDWRGAARSAGSAVAVMLAVSLVGVLLVTGADAGPRMTVALVLSAVCAAFGGDVHVAADVGGFGGAAAVGVLPLTVTFAGLGVLARTFATRLRSRGTTSSPDVLVQGVRTTLVLAVVVLVLAVSSRYRPEAGESLPIVGGRFGVSVRSSVTGAVLFSIATLGAVWLLGRRSGRPGRSVTAASRAAAPLAGAAAVFAAGLLPVLVAVVHGLVTGDEVLAQVGAAVLAAGNGALAVVLLSAGVPLSLDGGATSSVIGGLGASGRRSIDLFTVADAEPGFWLAPVALLLVLVAVATALALRQESLADARREGFRFAGALAVAAFAAALLLRVVASSEGSVLGVSGHGEASATFSPVAAALVLAVWGVAAGLLAPVVALRVPGGLVATLRSRLGTAAAQSTPGQQPADVPPHGAGPVGQRPDLRRFVPPSERTRGYGARPPGPPPAG